MSIRTLRFPSITFDPYGQLLELATYEYEQTAGTIKEMRMEMSR